MDEFGKSLSPDAEKFLEGYRSWRRSFENPANRRAQIKNICRRIAEEFQPEKIILFGSYAYGKPRPDSDVDILVIMAFDGGYFHQAAKIRQRLDSPVPMDLLVRTPEQIQYRLEIGDSFIQEILEQGRVMYEAHHV